MDGSEGFPPMSGTLDAITAPAAKTNRSRKRRIEKRIGLIASTHEIVMA